ncbi:helix-hairpin-helix domain-containing protein [Enterococcus italicus]|uniref:ComEA protein n=1 Tax=Enterococcus italicus (strain DSM 15952 / CCUG 50447 / LMG 22039 / TP 1.5) TaxID=888064 RepID=E6LGG2_ENTI1|nr:helix-hairpin-helix domain-containing protein [Enterococcus italicus]EFU73726.1 comEA protein [Enterococcus italicus DSM 15952]OJG59145.1 competence protein ComEA [Enterococcus italicus DSM 15952]
MKNTSRSTKQYLAIGSMLGLFGISIGVWFFLFQKPKEDVWTDVSVPTEQTTQTTTSVPQQIILVDIKGAVKKPGVYELPINARLHELVNVAGGLTDDAEDRQVNMAIVLADQQLVYIPRKGETVEQTNQTPQAGNESKVNINTASAEELQTLTGIGEKKAQAIIDYRTQNGNFQSIDQLTEVDGFGEKTVEKLRDSITI